MIKHNKNRKKLIIIGGSLLVIVVLTGLAFYINRSDAPTPISTKQPSITSNKGSQSSADQVTSPTNQASEQTNNKYPTSGTNTSSARVIAPSGTFVNNHTPGMSDSMLSICSTTPAISCQIRFTKNGTTRSLAVQTTDETGNTVWSWTPKSIGLTTGTWQITVTASAGSKSETVNDPIALEVQ